MTKNMRRRLNLACEASRPRTGVVIEQIEPRVLLSATPVAIDYGTQSSSPTAVVNAGGFGFFVAQGTGAVPTLYRTDGTVAGTVALKSDFLAGSTPTSLFGMGDVLYFSAADTSGNDGLWRSDGTVAGTVVVKNVSRVQNLIDYNGTLFFSAFGYGDSLWKSDGTTDGTIEVARTHPRGLSWVNSPAVLGNDLLFSALDQNNIWQLWESDGTTAGTIALTNQTIEHEPQHLITVGDKTFFTENRALWVTDGTPAGTVQVKATFEPGALPSPTPVAAVNGKLLFTTDQIGGDLWVSDGTPQGTISLGAIEIRPGAVLNGEFYFDGGTSARGLWKTDGTVAGTQAVGIPMKFANANSVAVLNQLLYIAAFDNHNVEHIWSSDGTAANTLALVNLPNPDPTNGYIDLLKTTGVAGGKLFFSQNDGFHGTELWTSDGTQAGTSIVADLNTTPVITTPINETADGDHLYFNTSRDPNLGGTNDLYSSGGTSGDSVFLGNVMISGNAVQLGQETYFAGDAGAPSVGVYSGQGAPALWKTDDTFAGTMSVLQFGSAPTELTSANGQLFFVAASPGQTTPLVWASDGTAGGTTPLTTSLATNPRLLTQVGSELVFASDQGIWQTDGTVGGTSLIQNLASIQSIKVVNGVAVIATSTAIYSLDQSGTSLQLLNDASTGPAVVPVADKTDVLLSAGGWAYFVGSDASSNDWLCRTDGTPAGTSRVVQIAATGPSALAGLYTVGTSVYFATITGANFQLWHSDGTAAGTISLGLFANASNLTSFGPILDAGGIAYFAAATNLDDGSLGTELWRSDGTPAGTTLLNDINPGGASSAPHNFFALGGKPFFLADDGTNGVQLFTITPPTQPPAVPSNLKATALSPYSAQLTWTETTAVGDLVGYQVERSLASDLSSITGIFTLGPAATSFTDVLANSDARVYYRLTAIGTGNRTSSVISVVPSLPDVTGPTASNPNGIPPFDPVRPQPPISPAYPNGAVFIDSTRAIFERPDALGVSQLQMSSGTPGVIVQLTHFKNSTDYLGWAVHSPVSAAGTGFFLVTSGLGFRSTVQLWKTNGTVAGTVLVWSLPVLKYNYSDLIVVGKRVLFTDGGAVWSSDGTTAGTVRIHTTFYDNTNYIGEIQSIEGHGYFTTHIPSISPTTGGLQWLGQLWITDGTAAGTKKIPLPVEQGVSQYSPGSLTQAGDTYFMAVDSGYWRMTIAPASAPAAPTGLTATPGPAGVTVNWTNHANNELYLLLERSTSPTFGTIDKSVTLFPGFFTYQDTTATQTGVVYYYRIYAYNRAGSSALAYTGHAITGSVYNDANASGKKDTGEAGVANVRLYIDANLNAKQDPGEISTVTDRSGNYSFPHMTPGKYTINEVTPAGWRTTSAATVTLTLGATADIAATPFAITQKGLISGSVFLDANKNGTFNTGEKQLANWRVFIDANKNGKFDTGESSVLTGTAGNWSFGALAAGSYAVCVVQQAGYTRTAPSAGSFAITLAAGTSSTGHAFGEKR